MILRPPQRFYGQWLYGTMLGALLGLAIAAPAHAQPLRRVLLAPWSSTENEAIESTPTLRGVEAALNYLGITLKYVDLDREKLPDPGAPEFAAHYLGALTCFSGESLKNSRKLVDWLTDLGKSGGTWVGVCQLGLLGAIPSDDVKKLFQSFGAEYTGAHSRVFGAQVSFKRASGMEFERKLARALRDFPPVRAPAGAGEAWLSLRAGANQASDPVFVSPRFSLAYGDYGLWIDYPRIDHRQWVVDPFEFFPKALRLDPLAPIPDVAVLNGARVFMSHVDGDAFESMSRVPTNGRNVTCGEKFETEIVARYPDLPVGASLIVGSMLDVTGRPSAFLSGIAGRIYAALNVEPASHTYSHPFEWATHKVAYPRSFSGAYRDERESVESVRFVDRVFSQPAGKRTEMLYWSGDCIPPENAIAAAEKAGFLNLNGGDSRFDEGHPSIAYLAALGRPMGNSFQIHSANANENIYTNLWEGPYDGFRKVIETFARTAAPRLLKPIDIYYHYYSLERRTSIQALHDIYAWVRKQDIAPVFPSVYARSVLGYRAARIEQLGPLKYRIKNARGLYTLRIEDPQGHDVDLERSPGVMGASRLLGRLYLHLDPSAGGKADITLVPATAPIASAPYVAHAGGLVTPLPRGLSLAPFTRGPIVLGGFPSEQRALAYRLKTARGEEARSAPIERGSVSIALEPSAETRELRW